LRRIPEEEVEIIPGISSFQYLSAESGMPINDAVLVSLHGRRNDRDRQIERLTGLVRLDRLIPRIVVFCDGEFSPSRIAGIVRGTTGEAGERVEVGKKDAVVPEGWTVCVGCNLGLESERIRRMPLEEAVHIQSNKDDLCVMILQREFRPSTG
jgi:precorrin-6B methylase 1